MLNKKDYLLNKPWKKHSKQAHSSIKSKVEQNIKKTKDPLRPAWRISWKQSLTVNFLHKTITIFHHNFTSMLSITAPPQNPSNALDMHYNRLVQWSRTVVPSKKHQTFCKLFSDMIDGIVSPPPHLTNPPFDLSQLDFWKYKTN